MSGSTMQPDIIQSTIPIWSQALGSWNVSITRNAFEARELKKEYDEVAGVWQSKIERLGFVKGYQRLMEAAFFNRALLPTRPLKVLDAGIGTGAMSTAFTQVVETPVEILGVDLSPRMLEEARENVTGPGVCIETLESDLIDLPVPSNSFDVVLMAHVVEHSINPISILVEMHRVLKPGGVLIASITCPSLFGRYIQLVWRTHRVTPDTACDWLEAAEFTVPEVVGFDTSATAGARSLGYIAHKAATPLRDGGDDDEL
ncbi:MAG: class I SAM-dependent methyltransferase [Pseudomonadota bacterium]